MSGRQQSPQDRPATYWLPGTLEPAGQILEAAGISVAYGANPISVPATLSEPARAAWAQLPRLPASAPDRQALAAVREFGLALEQLERDRCPEDLSLADETINGVTTTRVTPPDLAHEDRVLVFVHGGGYVMNTRRNELAFQASVASALRTSVVSIEYPLAPEHPYPAATNTIVNAYLGLLERYDPAGIGLFGTSAGAGLVLATLLSLRRDGYRLPAASASLSPAADATLSGDLVDLVGDQDPMVVAQDVPGCVEAYVGMANPRDPLVSPVFGDYTGVTPLFLLSGTRELIGSDAIRVATRAQQAGCDVTLVVLDGMWHVPIGDGTGVPELQHSFDQMVGFFRARLGR